MLNKVATFSGAVVADLSSDISGFVRRGVIPAIAVLIVAAGICARPLAVRLRITSLQAFWGLATTLPILAITLFGNDRSILGWNPLWLFSWWRHDWVTAVADAVDGKSGWWLNFILFLPAAFVWARVLGRSWRTLGLLMFASFLIESVQAVVGLGGADTADFVANSLGAGCGVALAYAWKLLRRSSSDASESAPQFTLKRLLVGCVVLTAIGALLYLAVAVGLGRRQDSLLAELHHKFDGQTYADIEPVFGIDSNRYNDFVYKTTSVAPDEMRQIGETDEAQARYPVPFFGLDGCVFVRWTKSGVQFRTATGDECTAFHG